MVWGRKGCLALVFGSVLAMAGCAYHTSDAGRERDFAIGDSGCEPNSRSRRDYANHYGYAPSSGGEPRELPTSVRPAPATAADLPVYVLPPDAISNAVFVDPNSLRQGVSSPPQAR